MRVNTHWGVGKLPARYWDLNTRCWVLTHEQFDQGQGEQKDLQLVGGIIDMVLKILTITTHPKC